MVGVDFVGFICTSLIPELIHNQKATCGGMVNGTIKPSIGGGKKATRNFLSTARSFLQHLVQVVKIISDMLGLPSHLMHFSILPMQHNLGCQSMEMGIPQ